MEACFRKATRHRRRATARQRSASAAHVQHTPHHTQSAARCRRCAPQAPERGNSAADKMKLERCLETVAANKAKFLVTSSFANVHWDGSSSRWLGEFSDADGTYTASCSVSCYYDGPETAEERCSCGAGLARVHFLAEIEHTRVSKLCRDKASSRASTVPCLVERTNRTIRRSFLFVLLGVFCFKTPEL